VHFARSGRSPTRPDPLQSPYVSESGRSRRPQCDQIEEDYNVQAVRNACGSGNQIAEEMVWRRMQCAGVQLNGANAMIAELVRNWASPAGAVGFALLT
jgi:hypothetical protein